MVQFEGRPRSGKRVPYRLTAHYPFEDPSDTTTATDTTGNGYDGPITGATYNGGGYVGDDSLTFDGTDDYVTLPGLGDRLAGETAFTICAWVRLPDLSVDQSLLSNWPEQYLFYMDAGGAGPGWRVGVDYAGGGTATFTSSDSANAEANTWQHVAATFKADEAVTLYVDGSFDNDTATNIPDIDPTTTDPTIANSNAGTTERLLQGDVDEVRLYDRRLAADEIAELASVGKP